MKLETMSRKELSQRYEALLNDIIDLEDRMNSLRVENGKWRALCEDMLMELQRSNDEIKKIEAEGLATLTIMGGDDAESVHQVSDLPK